jgi:ABC-2 type transport system permease protein
MSSHFWQETRIQAWRWFLHTRRRPVVVISGLFQPLIWMTLFVLVFRNSMQQVLGGSYLAFVTPGALLFTAFNASLNAGVPLLFDRELGFLDRLRVAPLADRFSIVLASAIHIAAITLMQCAVILLAALIFGVRFHGGAAGALIGFAALMLVILGFTALSIGLAFQFRRHFEMIAVVMIVTLPLVFLSSAFAPLDQLPVGLRALVVLNPVTQAIEPLRLVFASAEWSFTTPLASSWFGTLTPLHCFAGLLVFVTLAGLWSRGVLKKKLS